jgi:sarcosine oxidase, subunit alpha
VSDRAGRPTRRIDTDVLVVGGGRAGLFAALGAAEAGARVTVSDAESGSDPGWRRPGDDAGQTIGSLDELAAAAETAGVEVLGGVAAVGWYDGLVAAIAADAHLEIRAGAIVAATGSYDLVPLVPGADRPGVMAARTVIGLVERFGIRPGDRAVLVGTGSEVVSAGEALTRAGATEIIGPIPTAALVSIGGGERVTSVVVRADGATRRIDADLVVFADRSPNLDLVLATGAAVVRRDDILVPTLDPSGRTSVASLFAVGSAADRPILNRAAADAATATGRHAAAASAGRATVETAAGLMPVQPPPSETAGHSNPPGRVARGAIVCFCEDVRAWEIRAEVATGYDDPELVKRRTGALTGPCQGKYCLQSFACLVGETAIPTARPPLRPVRLGDLVGASDPGDPAAG